MLQRALQRLEALSDSTELFDRFFITLKYYEEYVMKRYIIMMRML